MPQLSLEFLVFVGLTTFLFWNSGERLRPWLLAVFSSACLLRLDAVSFVVLASLTLAVYLATGLPTQKTRWAWRLPLLALLVVFCGVKTWDVLGDLGQLPALLIPLGFGFYLLKLLHYWIDSDLRGFRQHGFLTFYNYMCFFPTIFVGPIHRFEEFERNERRRRWDAGLFAEGIETSLYGYAKVIILANWIASDLLGNWCAETFLEGTRAGVFGDGLVHGLYLYFAFSGYSDIACGVSRMFGQKVEANFHYPFLQRNLAAFWRCWHRSLSGWCREYIFVPVTARFRRPALGLIASMLAIGLWHEFTLIYVLWGLYHGIGLALFRLYEKHLASRIPQTGHPVLKAGGYALSTAATFVFVTIGFALTNNNSAAEIWRDVQLLVTGA